MYFVFFRALNEFGGTLGNFGLLWGTLGYCEVLRGTLRYFGNTSRYLTGTSGTSWYFPGVH